MSAVSHLQDLFKWPLKKCPVIGTTTATGGLENPSFTADFAAGFFSTSSTKGCNRAVPSSHQPC